MCLVLLPCDVRSSETSPSFILPAFCSGFITYTGFFQTRGCMCLSPATPCEAHAIYAAASSSDLEPNDTCLA